MRCAYLGNVVTDFLGGETKRTKLGGEGGSGTDFTTNSTHVDWADVHQQASKRENTRWFHDKYKGVE